MVMPPSLLRRWLHRLDPADDAGGQRLRAFQGEPLQDLIWRAKPVLSDHLEGLLGPWLKFSASVRSEAVVASALLRRCTTANDACRDATPSNKPLEWTGRRQACFDSNRFVPATQGQRSAALNHHLDCANAKMHFNAAIPL